MTIVAYHGVMIYTALTQYSPKGGEYVALGNNVIANSEFDTLTGWVSQGGAAIALANGGMQVTGNAGTGARTIVSGGAGLQVITFRLIDVNNNGMRIQLSGALNFQTQTFTAPGVYQVVVNATDSFVLVYALKATSAGSFTIDQISVRRWTMAIVQDGFRLYVQLVDSGGKMSNVSFDMVDTTYADATADITPILAALAAVTQSEIQGYSLQERFIEDALTLPSVGHNSERATVTVQLDSSPLKKAVINIPNPVDGVFEGAPGTVLFNDVDTADAALVAYVNLWQVTGAVAQLSDGEYVADTGGIIRGKRTHRQSSYG